MADGVYDNLFVNEHHGTPLGLTQRRRDRNIRILGRGKAILDGGNYNGLSEKTQLQDGLPPVYLNSLVFFTNAENLEFGGLALQNQRWWAMNFVSCSDGYLHDLDFCASDLAVDENGSLYRGLKREKYTEALVKNADGIDLRRGCHHFLIENITGFTEDDTVAITGLWGRVEKDFCPIGQDSDIHHILVRNVRAASFCTLVRLLNQGEVCLHDILVDGVEDTSAESDHLDRGIYGVRIGDKRLYGSRHATADETYNITVKNVRSRGQNAALMLVGEIGNLRYENVRGFDGAEDVRDRRPK